MILCVQSPNAKRECEGIYRLAFNVWGNGMPVWRHEESDRVLFSSATGKWYIKDSKAEKSKFQCKNFYLASSVVHNGMMPHDLDCTWRIGTNDTWKLDPDVKIMSQAGQRMSRVLKTSGDSLRALMLDFDATLTVVDEIPHQYRAELMESVLDDNWFREKIFGG